ncbi:hypothetical protein MRX96_018119 [Rhipicephalus microplus]
MSDTLRRTLPPYLDPDTFAHYDADVWKTASDQGALNIIDFVGPAWLLAAGYAMGLTALLLELMAIRATRRWLRRPQVASPACRMIGLAGMRRQARLHRTRQPSHAFQRWRRW